MKIGFLGAGAMGGAILDGAINSGIIEPKDVYVFDMSDKIIDKYTKAGCNIVSNNEELGKASDMVVLAVKPQHAATALAELKNTLNGKAALSIMAGKTTDNIRSMIDGDIRLLRIMPNTPALVSAGAFACDSGTDFTAEEKEFAEKMLGSIALIEWMPENLINAACALSGAGPAYVALIIEALADGGVKEGLPRVTAQKLAAQTVLGTAKMVLETGMHPGQIKDMVCSPAGNTIVGVQTMEEHGVRGALIDTVANSRKRVDELASI